jgi:hypothetical protein
MYSSKSCLNYLVNILTKFVVNVYMICVVGNDVLLLVVRLFY